MRWMTFWSSHPGVHQGALSATIDATVSSWASSHAWASTTTMYQPVVSAVLDDRPEQVTGNGTHRLVHQPGHERVLDEVADIVAFDGQQGVAARLGHFGDHPRAVLLLGEPATDPADHVGVDHPLTRGIDGQEVARHELLEALT